MSEKNGTAGRLPPVSSSHPSIIPLSVAPRYGAVRSSSIVLVLVLVLVIDSWLPAPRKIEDDDEDDYEHDKDESRQAP
jgi:hypothetical protein